jgi:hypothetical protein
VSFSKIFGVEIFGSFLGSNDHSYVMMNVADHFNSRVLYVHTSNHLLRIKFLKSTSPRLLSLVEVGSSGPTPVTPVFLSYLNCITNHSLKNLLNLFRRLSSRSPPPDFPPFRHHAVSSYFSAEPPVPFPFPLALPSCYITIVSRSAACACPAMIVGAVRVSPLFFSHILFKSILFLSSNFFSQTLFFVGFLFLFLLCAAYCLLEL